MIFIFGCKNDNSEIAVNPSGETILKRIGAPHGFEWVIEEPGSFGEFLQNSELRETNSKILDYRGVPISNQSEHVAVLTYDVGTKDLQQCADAVIRLRAEYLYHRKKFNQLYFHFTNGDVFSWNDYKSGIRPRLINANTISFNRVAGKDDSYKSFRNYLDVVFMYAGTISLNNESTPVRNNKNIKTGDFLVTPGSPGHAVIIVGRAKNKSGKTIFLLAEGYTPAQSIHVITNPYDGSINPWYELDINNRPTITARYTFIRTNIRAFNN